MNNGERDYDIENYNVNLSDETTWLANELGDDLADWIGDLINAPDPPTHGSGVGLSPTTIDYITEQYLQVQRQIRSKKSRPALHVQPIISRGIDGKDVGINGIVDHVMEVQKSDTGNIYALSWDDIRWETSPYADVKSATQTIPTIRFGEQELPLVVQGHAFMRLEERAGIEINHAVHFIASALNHRIVTDKTGQPFLTIFDAVSLEPLGLAPLEATRCNPIGGEQSKEWDVWLAKTVLPLSKYLDLDVEPHLPSVYVETALSREDQQLMQLILSQSDLLDAETIQHNPGRIREWIIDGGMSQYFWPLFDDIFLECARHLGDKVEGVISKNWMDNCLQRAEIPGDVWNGVRGIITNTGMAAEVAGILIQSAVLTEDFRATPFSHDDLTELRELLSAHQIGPAPTERLMEALDTMDRQQQFMVARLSNRPGDIAHWKMTEEQIRRRSNLGNYMHLKRVIREQCLK